MKHRNGRRSPTLLCWLTPRLSRLGWLLRHGTPAKRPKQHQSHGNRARGGVSRLAPTASNPSESLQPANGKAMARPQTAKIKIRGRVWTVIFRPVPCEPTLFGICDYDTKTIRVHPGKEPRGTLIHEVIHACLPDLSETAVDETERAITKALEVFEL